MITMDHEFLGKEVVLPSLQSPYKSIKFLVIGGVVEMTPFEFLTKIVTAPIPILDASH